MKSLDNYISEQLFKHLNIDYNILENAGLYDGIEELCYFLSNKIKSHKDKLFNIQYKDTDIELSKMNNIFFKRIILRCERSNKFENDGEYVNNDAIDFDTSCNKFNYILINLYLSQKHNPEEVYSILLHEITHAWDDFNAFKKNSTPLKYSSKSYHEIVKLLDDSTGYSKLLSNILYYITPAELNARVAELAGSLYEFVEDNTISDPHKALNLIKNSPIYKNYIRIGEWVDAMYDKPHKFNKNNLNELCDEYNKIYKTNYTEYKVRKLLYTQYHKAMNKIESSIGKLCVRYIKHLTTR